MCDSTITVVVISLVSVLWIVVLVNVRARKCWRLLLLTNLLHPIWIVDRVA